MIHLHQNRADRFIPDGATEESALARTTHLAVVAHQDDLEILAFHGIAECIDSNEAWFTGIVVADGAGSPRSGPYASLTDEQMTELRKEEQQKAATLGQYSAVFQLGHASAQIKSKNSSTVVRQDLECLLKAARPKYVYLHNPSDSHDTHVAVCMRSIEALRNLSKQEQPEKVWGCEVWRDLDWLTKELKVSLPVSKHPLLAMALCAVFESQVAGGKRYDQATIARRTAHATFSSSHETDKETALTLAVDLTPLLTNPALTVEDFTLSLIDRFRDDVRDRIQRMKP